MTIKGTFYGLPIAFGPATASLNVAANGAVSGTAGPFVAHSVFLLYGYLPVTATFQLNATAVTGSVTNAGQWQLSMNLTAQVTSAKLLGLIPLWSTASTCQTSSGAVFNFNQTGGSTVTPQLTGTGSFPAFTGCGGYSGLLTGAASGPTTLSAVTLPS